MMDECIDNAKHIHVKGRNAFDAMLKCKQPPPPCQLQWPHPEDGCKGGSGSEGGWALVATRFMTRVVSDR
ncbi:unnamed protein product [Mesocestoides corti]|uniref:Pentatricopeptide repeat-containing protein n=1 Tax=Mesocestoides corti TaxID=53468 RepID=A0A0R3UH04_MESCO|nr:unnamed protein product [Mesocestoides corti]